MGVTPSGPLKANSGVRARVPAAGKMLEGDDQQIYVHYITMLSMLYVVNLKQPSVSDGF